MIIETERLILREYSQDDFDALYEILSDEQTMKHYPKPYNQKGIYICPCSEENPSGLDMNPQGQHTF